MLAGELGDEVDLGFGQVSREDAGHADAFRVDVQHDHPRRVGVVVEELLQDVDHELLRGVVVVVQEDFIERRPGDLRSLEGPQLALALGLVFA